MFKFLLTFSIIFLTACTSTPRETVEISDTVGRDLVSLQQTNLVLIDTLFDRMEGDVIRFIDNEYRPAYVKKLVTDFQLINEINLAVASDEPEAVLWVLDAFVAGAVEDINLKQSELLSKIRAQRKEVRSETDRAFNQVRGAHAVVTAHLASIVKVQDTQSQILAKVGLKDVQQKIASKTAGLSQSISKITTKSKTIDGTVEENVDTLNQYIAQIEDHLN